MITHPEHTPGPWTAFYKHKYREWHVSVPMQLGGMLGLFPDGVPTENPEGDARLIAAAPQMLKMIETQIPVLKAIRPFLDESVGYELETAIGWLSEAATKAREASDAA